MSRKRRIPKPRKPRVPSKPPAPPQSELDRRRAAALIDGVQEWDTMPVCKRTGIDL